MTRVRWPPQVRGFDPRPAPPPPGRQNLPHAPRPPPSRVNRHVIERLPPLWRYLAENYRGPDLQRFLAQDGLCGVCGKRLPFTWADKSPEGASRDHVWPRLPAYGGALRHMEGRAGLEGNTLLAHTRCNRKKGRRPPTGCELVRLAAVNARLHIANGSAFAAEPPPWRYRATL